MRVVLDSNVIIKSQYYLRSAEMQAILSAAAPLHIEILVPEVVYEEVCGGFRRDLKDRIDALQDALNRLEVLCEDDSGLPTLFQLMGGGGSRYDLFLQMQLAKRPFRMLPFPNMSHREAIKAAASKRKPFGGKNDGYGDFLIWRSVVEEIKCNTEDGTLYFISDNRNDFSADPKGDPLRLHADLIGDLRS